MARHLLAFGTELYQKGWDRLEQVPAELDAIVRLFTDFGYTEQLTELRHDPETEPLRIGLETWVRDEARSPDDIVVVYYTGHGFTEGGVHYLATASTPVHSAVTALRSDDFVVMLGTSSPLRRVLVILDVCHAEAGARDATDLAQRVAAFRTKPRPGEGFWVLAVSRTQEEAQQGAFACALSDAVAELKGGTGNSQEYLDLLSLIGLVNKRLPARQQAGYMPAYMETGVPPFLPNRDFSPEALSGEDLEAAARGLHVRELEPHWDPKSRGVDVARQAGSYFTGRNAAVDAVLTWLENPGEHPACVVTGQPGAGKSAVLGHILFLAHPGLREDGGAPAASGPLSGALLARGKTHVAVREELASDLAVVARDGRELGEALARRGEDVTLLIDALDEADGTEALIQEVLGPLIVAAEGRVRLLLGTRRDALANLPFDYRLIDLDSPAFYRREDIADYVTAILLDRSSKSPYRDAPDAAHAAAKLVADRAKGSFLIARVAARTLVRSARPLSDAEIAAASRVWNEVGRAFDHDLARYAEDERRVRDLLLPLAFARGAGLPWETLWAPLASALSDSAYDDEDVRWLHAHAGAYVVEATYEAGTVYRLVHQELAKHLRTDVDERDAENRIVDTLLEHVPTARSGRRNWFATHPYLRRHLPRHAALAGRLDELLEDPGFLVAAEPLALTRAALEATTERGAAAAAVHRLAIEQLAGRSWPERTAALALAARLRDATWLADAADALLPDLPWRALWADWQGHDPHQVLTRMPAAVSALAGFWSREGRPLVAAADLAGTLRVIDVEHPHVVAALALGASVWCLGVADVDGHRLLLAGTFDGRLHVIRTDRWQASVLQAHDNAVAAVTAGVLDGGPVVVTGESGLGGGAALRLWAPRGPDAADWTALTPAMTAFGGSVRRLHMVELDGRTVIVAAGDPLDDPEEAGGMVRLIDPRTGERVDSLDITGVRVGSIATDLDATGTLVTRTYMRGLDDRLSLWDLPTRTETAVSGCAHASGMSVARAVVAGRAVIAVPSGQAFELRDAQTLEPLSGWRPVMVPGVRVLCGAPDGRHLVTGGEDGAVRLWDLGWRQTTAGAGVRGRGPRLVATARPEREPLAVTTGPDAHEVRGLRDGRRRCLLPAGRVDAIAAAGNHVFLARSDDVHKHTLDGVERAVFRLGDPPHGVQVQVVGRGAVQAMAAGNESLLAVSCWDFTVRLIDGDTGEPVGPPLRQGFYDDKVMYGLAFAAVQGRPALIAGGASGDLIAWTLDDRSRSELPGGSNGYIHALAVARGSAGDVLFRGGDDGRLVAVDLSSLTVTPRERAHQGDVTAVCVSGAQVVTGGDDGFLRVWDLTLEPQAEIALDAEVTGLAAGDGIVLAGTMAGVVAIDLHPAPAVLR
jgi:WD40 repeat protein